MCSRLMRVAVEGCGHGTLHAIYASIKKTSQIKGWNGIDLLIIGGDFQAVRNSQDLNGMSVPMKYREIGDFHEYYSGIRTAPYLTIFVGGNHEASSHLFELYYGGWVAPNIYYLGAANVVRCGPLRIAGLSGIWKGYNYKKPHYERLPYNQDDLKSIYHVRELDVRKLMQVRTQVDIGISHDWPRGVEWLGDWKGLFRFKQHFENDARTGQLGSVAAKLVMDRLRPAHWFAAHLHCKFAACVDYSNDRLPVGTVNDAMVQNADEINVDLEEVTGSNNVSPPQQRHNHEEICIDLDELNEGHETLAETESAVNSNAFTDDATVTDDLRAQLPASFSRIAQPAAPTSVSPLPPTGISNKTTRFLALDKCLPNRKFLQLLEVEPFDKDFSSAQTTQFGLSYDPEWLAITRVFASELVVGDRSAHIPPNRGEAHYKPLIEAEEKWVHENIVSADNLRIPENFERTAPVYDSEIGIRTQVQPLEYTNPQTSAFCRLLDIHNPFDISEEERQKRREEDSVAVNSSVKDGTNERESRGWGRGQGHAGRGGRNQGRGRRGRS